MTEGVTCYERDEDLCEDQMSLRVGCRLRNERLSASRPAVEHLTYENMEAAFAEFRKALTIMEPPASFDSFSQGYVSGWNARETQLNSASGDVRAAVIEPTDGHGHTGEFTATEFNERAWDHEKAAKNGLSAGPNVSYVRTFQACAVALRYAAKHMFSQSPATDAAADDLKHHARFLLDRLQEFDPGDFEAEREFHGHVAPAIARLRNALGVA